MIFLAVMSYTPTMTLRKLTTWADILSDCLFSDGLSALGNHSYTMVISTLQRETSHFRVLALSATPGDNVSAVQQVLSNLVCQGVFDPRLQLPALGYSGQGAFMYSHQYLVDLSYRASK
jgi:hypothetical protein